MTARKVTCFGLKSNTFYPIKKYLIGLGRNSFTFMIHFGIIYRYLSEGALKCLQIYRTGLTQEKDFQFHLDINFPDSSKKQKLKSKTLVTNPFLFLMA
jgi:hypothetical protein